MQQDRGRGQYICSKRGDEGSIYAARQGMRAYNNTNMRNPIIKDVGGLRMLVLLHAPIPCLAAYILPPSPVLLHIYCPHPLSCCIYTALIPCLAAYILHLFPTFWYCHPYILQHLMEMFVSLLFRCRLACKYIMPFACVRAPPILLLVVM